MFVLLTATLGYGICVITKQSIKLIKAGVEDAKIKTEYEKFLKKQKGSKALSAMDRVVSLCLFVVVLSVFVVAMFANVTGKEKVGATPTMQVVQSGSMSYKNEKNKYVYNNDDVTNQLQIFDLILVHQLPAESELEEFDIVVYQIDDALVIHRIVAIEEPNEKHSERYFLLQGDASESHDRFPVTYEQMKGIYRNQRVPFVGSLIMFLQSPAGYLCILLIAVGIFVTPAVEKRLWSIKMERLAVVGISADATAEDKRLTKDLCQKVNLTMDKIPTKKTTAYKPVARVNLDGKALNVHVKFVANDKLAKSGKQSNVSVADGEGKSKIRVSVKDK